MEKEKKGKSSQKVKVVVRIRPLSQMEIESNCTEAIKISGQSVTVKDKLFKFDRVYRPDSKQSEVYDAVIGPMILDVINGFNCTVFAYGQTGTGKTFTMTGGIDSNNPWEKEPSLGCIPRACVEVFNKINTMVGEDDYSVKISYLEIYNEELRDLLSEPDDLTPLNIYNDPNHKGSVCIVGLKEMLVKNKEDVARLLIRGTSKRQTAATKLNIRSSRSHTVFTITVHLRLRDQGGEDVFKCGKLNLIDLAGSESMSRAGSGDKPLEGKNINKSLLTLARVIQSLVEKKKHIPYRDSKLTRILSDSLGGQTKTCIIATVSPASNAVDETSSTLDYAYRAKDIKNNPVVNEKTTKTKSIKKLQDEIERCRRDLNALRLHKGIFIKKEEYESIVGTLEESKEELVSKKLAIRALRLKIKEMREFLKVQSDNWDELMDTFQKLKEERELYERRNEATHKTLQREKYITKIFEKRKKQLEEVAGSLHEHNLKQLSDQEKLLEKVDKYHGLSRVHEKFAESISQDLFYNLDAFSKDCTAGTFQINENISKTNEIYETIIESLKKLLLQTDKYGKLIQANKLKDICQERIYPTYSKFADTIINKLKSLDQDTQDTIKLMLTHSKSTTKVQHEVPNLHKFVEEVFNDSVSKTAEVLDDIVKQKTLLNDAMKLDEARTNSFQKEMNRRNRKRQTYLSIFDKIEQQINDLKNTSIETVMGTFNDAADKMENFDYSEFLDVTNDEALPNLARDAEEIGIRNRTGIEEKINEFKNAFKADTEKEDKSIERRIHGIKEEVKNKEQILRDRTTEALERVNNYFTVLKTDESGVEIHLNEINEKIYHSTELLMKDLKTLIPIKHEGDTPSKTDPFYKTLGALKPLSSQVKKFSKLQEEDLGEGPSGEAGCSKALIKPVEKDPGEAGCSTALIKPVEKDPGEACSSKALIKPEEKDPGEAGSSKALIKPVEKDPEEAGSSKALIKPVGKDPGEAGSSKALIKPVEKDPEETGSSKALIKPVEKDPGEAEAGSSKALIKPVEKDPGEAEAGSSKALIKPVEKDPEEAGSSKALIKPEEKDPGEAGSSKALIKPEEKDPGEAGSSKALLKPEEKDPGEADCSKALIKPEEKDPEEAGSSKALIKPVEKDPGEAGCSEALIKPEEKDPGEEPSRPSDAPLTTHTKSKTSSKRGRKKRK